MAFTRTSHANSGNPQTLVGSTLSVTLPTVNAGDFVWVVAYAGINGTPITSFTVGGVAGTTKTAVIDSGNIQSAQHGYLKNANAGTSVTVTVTFSVSGVGFCGVYAAAWSGCDTAVGFDKEATTFATGVTTATTGSVTTTGADLCLCATTESARGDNTYSVGTNFAWIADQNPIGTAGGRWGYTEHFIQSSAGSVAGQGKCTSSDTLEVMMMCVLPAPSPAGAYLPTHIPNKNVGPVALRQRFRQPTIISPVQGTAPSTGTTFRTTLSSLGTRAGSRQPHKT